MVGALAQSFTAHYQWFRPTGEGDVSSSQYNILDTSLKVLSGGDHAVERGSIPSSPGHPSDVSVALEVEGLVAALGPGRHRLSVVQL